MVREKLRCGQEVSVMSNCKYPPCSKPLVRRGNESASNFKKRVHCDNTCRSSNMRESSKSYQGLLARGEVVCAWKYCETVLKQQEDETDAKFLKRKKCLTCKPVRIIRRGSKNIGRPKKGNPSNAVSFNTLMGSMRVNKT